MEQRITLPNISLQCRISIHDILLKCFDILLSTEGLEEAKI